jgi:ABC-type sulfate transport system permease component
MLEGLSVTIVKALAATAAMLLVGVVILLLMKGMQPGRVSDVIRLAVVVPTAAAVYMLAAKLLRSEMLALFTRGAPQQERAAGSDGRNGGPRRSS